MRVRLSKRRREKHITLTRGSCRDRSGSRCGASDSGGSINTRNRYSWLARRKSCAWQMPRPFKWSRSICSTLVRSKQPRLCRGSESNTCLIQARRPSRNQVPIGTFQPIFRLLRISSVKKSADARWIELVQLVRHSVPVQAISACIRSPCRSPRLISSRSLWMHWPALSPGQSFQSLP